MHTTSQQSEYDAFRKFLEDACGILLGDNKSYLVNSRLKPVIAKHKVKGLGELLTKLKLVSSSALREEVVDAMTTNETLWFRDNHPFRILNDILYPEFSEKLGMMPLKIWSAACSTGQEPYSIAITADEYKASNPGKLKGGVKVLATDISTSVLEVAKAGVYEMLALGRGMSETRLKKCFQTNCDKSWQIKPQYKSVIEFKILNLMESFSRVGSKFDVIFCRNVLIYFSPDLKREILLKFHQHLNPGSYLILGASESLNGLSDKYEMIQCRPGIIYRAK
ncbi:MAG: chemotaxis protein methyltransferase CheR [Pseudohongiellaceae bacterium]|jgi:chemotaxis protein methyltransferase CheR